MNRPYAWAGTENMVITLVRRARKRRATLLSFSRYSAPRGLRQGPGWGSESPSWSLLTCPLTCRNAPRDRPERKPVPASDTRVFSLPAALSRKADPALVADDERHLAAVAAAVEEAVADLEERLDAARPPPARSGQGGPDRDQEVHRLTARLRTL